MIRCIQDVVLHEIGHYFGLDDEALYALEEGEGT
jgi:predicted Zn-dependent protease with MMP-like domain